MISIKKLLNETETKWRDNLSEHYPLWSNIPVEKQGPKQEKDWSFSTDLKKIYALIFKDENLQKKFKNIITKYWEGTPEELAEETMHYLLFHELYHPLEAPFSKKDNKEIHKAIRKGLINANPKLSPLEQVLKVTTSQNGIKDFIGDNRFAIDNEGYNFVNNNIIPVWDVLELDQEKPKTDFYTITRYLYGQLYGPKTTHKFFSKKAKKQGVKTAKKALQELLKKVPSKKENIIESIRSVFSSEDRYQGIERFVSALEPYIKSDMPRGRGKNNSGGASSQDILQDLLDDMNGEEQQQFLTGLVSEIGSGKGEEFTQGTADSVSNFNITKDEINNLELKSIHEFYKKNHPKIKIVGGNKKGESVVVGKKEKFILKNSYVITEDKLRNLNLKKISNFQQRTNLPVIIPLKNKTYRINEYHIKEEKVKDIIYVDIGLDIPEHIDFYLDSSGSMFQKHSNMGFNDNSSWDMLSNVLYGYIDALYQASIELKKPCSLSFKNFANKQISSRNISVNEFWNNGPSDVSKVLFKPENGYNVEDINIDVINDGKRRSYVIVTDGELVLSGRTKRESKKMKQLAKQPNTDVILFEIGGSYSLGKAVKNDPNIHYLPVHDKNKMLQYGLEVMLSK